MHTHVISRRQAKQATRELNFSRLTKPFLRWLGGVLAPMPGDALFSAASDALSRALHAQLRDDGTLPPPVRGALRLCVRRVGDVSFTWHRPANPAKARFFVADDPAQRALLRDQLERHNFQQLAVLNRPGNAMDRAVVVALRVPRLSDRSAFSTAVEVGGARSTLPRATAALRGVLKLLGEGDGGTLVTVSRVKRLERHFVLPGVSAGASSGPLDAAWTCDSNVSCGAEGALAAARGAESGGGVGGGVVAEVLICGANEDYAAELQDEVVRDREYRYITFRANSPR